MDSRNRIERRQGDTMNEPVGAGTYAMCGTCGESFLRRTHTKRLDNDNERAHGLLFSV